MLEVTIVDQDNSNEFTLEDNGTTSILREFEGFDYPEVRSVIEDVAGKKSAVHVTNKFGRRRSSLTGDIVGGNVFATRRQLLSVLRQTGRMKLIKLLTYDHLELQFEADVTKVVAPYNHQIQSFLIELVAADWRFYSQVLHSNDSVAPSQDILNVGTERTEPIFKIYGPFTEVEIMNLSSSEIFSIEHGMYGIDAGDYVTINCMERTVMLNDTTPIYSSFQGDFFSILPGVNTLMVSFTGDGEDTRLVTTWRDAYNGL